jgi:hypothetical protein
VVQQSATDTASTVTAAVAPVLGLVGDAAIVLVLVTFMLIERRLLRDRLMRLVGHHRLATTTKTIDEAGDRISRYLLVQLAVNTFYGVVVGLGLHFIGLPHALLWGSAAAILRFVPYIGPWLAAIPPVLLSLAVTPGWLMPIAAIALYVGLELFTNLILETYLYAGVAGVSQVGLLVAVLFWSWLWGPAGLLLAAPLTVCLVVIGKHLPALSFFYDLMTDDVSTDIAGRYYQRLLAEDQLEAAEIIEQYAKNNGAYSVFDALMIPALSFAERDVANGALGVEEEKALQERSAELLGDLISAEETKSSSPGASRSRVLAFPVNDRGDLLAARMLAHALADSTLSLEIGSARSLHSEIVALMQASECSVLCIVDLPPSSPTKTRYLVHRIRTALVDARIVVCRFAPAALADSDVAEILAAGANYVMSSLTETRKLLPQITTPSADLPADARSRDAVPVVKVERDQDRPSRTGATSNAAIP